MVLLAIIIGVLVGLSIAAVILSSACSLVRVQPPGFFAAMMICVLVGFVVLSAQLAAGVAGTLGAGGSVTGLRTALDFQRLMERGAVVGMVSTPFLSAAIYSMMLRECSFLRGLLIWVAQFVVVAIFVVGVYVLIVGLGLKH
jgi:hypothetical protein